MPDIDPITLEIMRNRFRGIAEEMCAALVRTAFSTNIKDRRDCSAALALPSGEVVAQAEVGVPLHLGTFPGVMESVMAVYPLDAMRPGDCYITNLPYPDGPGHLPDVTMVSPVFHDGAVVALSATTAHHVDMGGFAPGSMPFGVSEIYQEGLQIPPTPIIRAGALDDVVLRLINQNVRTRDEVRGDLLAQYAAARIANQRVGDLLIDQTPQEMHACMHAVLDHAERCMRAGIAALPDGDYRFEDYLDDDGFTDDPIRIAVCVTIAGETMRVDFAGTSDQVRGPLNARLSAARSAVYYVCKTVIDPDLPTCAGAYRPIEVVAPEGSILQAKYPAAIGNANIITDQRIVDVLMGALREAAPTRVCAACSGQMNIVNVGGIDPRTGRHYNYVETYGGGQGAMHDLDGADGMHTHLTNTRNAAVEVIERAYPLEVLRYGLIPDSEGAGEHRGGCGMVRELRCLGETTRMSLGSDRRTFTPWGVDTDHRARGAHACVNDKQIPTKVVTELHQGDVLKIETPGGGGWGDPRNRPPEGVQGDVDEGLISSERAKAVYGQS